MNGNAAGLDFDHLYILHLALWQIIEYIVRRVVACRQRAQFSSVPDLCVSLEYNHYRFEIEEGSNGFHLESG
jgi:hypothetical protein